MELHGVSCGGESYSHYIIGKLYVDQCEFI